MQLVSWLRGLMFAGALAGLVSEAVAQQDPPREQQSSGERREGDRGPGGDRRPGGSGFGGPGGPGGQGGGRGGFIGRGPGGPGGGFGGGELMLLANEQVQKELELIEDQVKDFEKLREEQRAKMGDMFGGLRDLPEEERRAKFEEMRGKLEATQKEMREQIYGVLMPHQVDRLKEINIQIRGPGALDDAEVAAELKITEDQKKQLIAVREEVGQKMREMFANRGEGRGEDMRAKFQEMQNQTIEKLLGVLTPEQRDQFEKMKGEKFELDRSQMFGVRGPGGPGGPGGPVGRRPEGGGRRPEGDRRPESDRTN